MRIYFIVVIMAFSFWGYAQGGAWYGVKGGYGLNNQKWNDFDREFLIAPFFDIFSESYSDDSPSSLYAQLGYHVRGSSTRFSNPFSGGLFTQGFRFNNLVLELGAKRILSESASFKPYYILGIRGEYTLSTNLDDYLIFESPYYPFNDFVRKFNYGVTVGGGFEHQFSEFVSGFIEFAVNPDLSAQYRQDPIPNVIDPFTNQLINLGERVIRNLSFEIKAGVKFLRKVEYY